MHQWLFKVIKVILTTPATKKYFMKRSLQKSSYIYFLIPPRPWSTCEHYLVRTWQMQKEGGWKWQIFVAQNHILCVASNTERFAGKFLKKLTPGTSVLSTPNSSLCRIVSCVTPKFLTSNQSYTSIVLLSFITNLQWFCHCFDWKLSFPLKNQPLLSCTKLSCHANSQTDVRSTHPCWLGNFALHSWSRCYTCCSVLLATGYTFWIPVRLNWP